MESQFTLRSARIGKIGFINTVPFYHQTFPDKYKGGLIEGPPADLNRLMASGELDMAPISSLEYALHPDLYYLLPKMCIGSRDFSRSVLLLSHEQFEGLRHKRIFLSSRSLSSATLLKILLRFRYEYENEFIMSDGSAEEMLAEGDAALIIGDEALYFKPKSFVFKYDLSELWWNWTHLPFCFSVWAVRQEYYKKNPQAVFKFSRFLKENTEKNLQDLESLIRDALGYTIADEQFSIIFGYLFNLAYFMDDKMLRGLKLFYRLAERGGYAPHVGKLRFIEDV